MSKHIEKKVMNEINKKLDANNNNNNNNTNKKDKQKEHHHHHHHQQQQQRNGNKIENGNENNEHADEFLN